MNNSLKHLLWILLGSALLFIGCKSKQQVSTVDIPPTTLSCKLMIELKNGENSLSSPADLKMVTDSVIWLSVQPFLGIEMLRAEFTADSVKVIDRMNKRYVAERVGDIRSVLPKEFDFKNLQMLLAKHLLKEKQSGELPVVHLQHKELAITFRFSRIERDVPLNLNFSIPAKYKRITFAQILKSITNNRK